MDQTLAGQHSPRVIILGCGQLGHACGLALAASGIACLGIRRNPPPDLLLPGLFRYHAGDIARPDTFAQWLTPRLHDIIFCPTPDRSSDEAYSATYVEPVAQLLEALAARQLNTRVTFISSTSVYGQTQGETVDETSPTHPKGFNGQRLLEAERLLLDDTRFAAHLVLRLSGIYSPSRTRLLDRLCRGQCSDTDVLTNRIHLEDAARAAVYLINQPKLTEQRYCISDDQPARESELLHWLTPFRLQQGSPAPPPSRTVTGKAVSNTRLRATGFNLLYPSFREGYGEILRNRI